MPMSSLDPREKKNSLSWLESVAIYYQVKLGQFNFSFLEIKCTGEYNLNFGKIDGITFSSKETPRIVGLTGTRDGNGVHFGSNEYSYIK